MHPSDGEYGTAGRPPGGGLTDPVSPLNPYWLSQGNHVMSRSFPPEALEARCRPVRDPGNPSLSVTSQRPERSSRLAPNKSRKHTSIGGFSKPKDVFLLRKSYIFLWLWWCCGMCLPAFTGSGAVKKLNKSQYVAFLLLKKTCLFYYSLSIMWPRSTKHSISQSKK